MYIINDVETHQLVFRLKYHDVVLHMLHDDYFLALCLHKLLEGVCYPW